ncbi:MAG: hypothetical protein H6851_09650 [Geminicoccaceae bacterium]|nr:hypothetical protein [Geminicoccaceae bacterium]
MDAFALPVSTRYPIHRELLADMARRGPHVAQAFILLSERLERVEGMRVPDDDGLLARCAQQTPKQWAKTRAAMADQVETRDGMFSLKAMHLTRKYQKLASSSGTFGQEKQMIDGMAGAPLEIRPGESQRDARHREDMERLERLRGLDPLYERMTHDREDLRAEKTLVGYMARSRSRAERAARKAEAAMRDARLMRANVAQRMYAHARQIYKSIPAPKVPSSVIDWLVDRWQKTGSSRYADVWAAAYLGGRFFEMWARDGPPG